MKKALSSFEEKRYDDAIVEFKLILQEHPNHLDVQFNLGLTYNKVHSYKEAIRQLKHVCSADPTFNKGEAWYQLAFAYQRLQYYEQAVDNYDSCLKVNCKNESAWFNRGLALEALEREEDAVESYSRSIGSNDRYVEPYSPLIALLKKRKDFARLVYICDQYTLADPGNHEAYYDQGFSYFQLGQMEYAIQCFQSSINCNQHYTKPFLKLAEAFCKMNQETKALMVYRSLWNKNRAYLTNTETAYLLLRKAILESELDRYQDAIDSLTELLKINPNNEKAKEQLGHCYEELGNQKYLDNNFQSARCCFQEARKHGNQRLSLFNNTTLLFIAWEKMEEAEKYVSMALKKDPKNMKALSNLVTILEVKEKFPEALKVCQDMLKIDETKTSYEVIGRLNFRMKNYEEAYLEFNRAVKVNQATSTLYNNFAITCEKINKLDEAEKYAKKANQLTKHRNPLFLLNHAKILVEMRNMKEAGSVFVRVGQCLRDGKNPYLSQLKANHQSFMNRQLSVYAYLMKSPEGGSVSNPQSRQLSEFEKEEMIRSQLKREDILKRLMSLTIENGNCGAREFEQLKKKCDLFEGQIKYMMEQQKFILEMSRNAHMNKLYNSKLQEFYERGELQSYRYTRQLYWVLHGYINSYMQAKLGVVQKGDNIDRGIITKGISSVRGIMEFMKNVPVIGDFSDSISSICGFLVDMSDEVAIDHLYRIITHSFNTVEDMSAGVCEAVLAVACNPKKMKDVKNKTLVSPDDQSFLERVKGKIEAVMQWLDTKKKEIICALRSIPHIEDYEEIYLAEIDAGIIVAVLLTMHRGKDSWSKNVLVEAANQAYKQGVMQKMLCDAYQHKPAEKQSCLVM